jgi:tRNA-2-methylthio-N6-dimethylallyladenosine synthase
MLITSDIIVGFPGETEEEFSDTLSLMEEVGYVDSFSFMFSPRPETKAAAFIDSTGKGVKLERLNRLLTLQKKLTAKIQASMVGQSFDILVEGSGRDEGQIFGRTSGSRIVNLQGSTDLVGTLRKSLILKAMQNCLLGELV